MKTLSLKAVTLMVVSASVISFLSHANDASLKELKTTQFSNLDFNKLAQDFDKNKDGLLSKSELEAGKGLIADDKLTKAFGKIDLDGDATISEKELNAFISKTKNKLANKLK